MFDKQLMIEHHLKGRDIHNERVLEAMYTVERELFVPTELRHKAYKDSALPIGRGQTISQPYIVAYMAQALDLKPSDTVLEIGSGCGYNAAVMSKLVKHVYSMEIIDWLAGLANSNLQYAGIENVTVITADGTGGWPDYAPYDKIVLTAMATQIPPALKVQLKVGGKLLAPVNKDTQVLVLMEKLSEENIIEKDLIQVRFVPLTGEAENEEEDI